MRAHSHAQSAPAHSQAAPHQRGSSGTRSQRMKVGSPQKVTLLWPQVRDRPSVTSPRTGGGVMAGGVRWSLRRCVCGSVVLVCSGHRAAAASHQEHLDWAGLCSPDGPDYQQVFLLLVGPDLQAGGMLKEQTSAPAPSTSTLQMCSR